MSLDNEIYKAFSQISKAGDCMCSLKLFKTSLKLIV